MSWKTTTLGVLTILAAASNAGIALLDADPATNPEWAVVIAAITAGIGLMTARDHDKSSEDAGIK